MIVQQKHVYKLKKIRALFIGSIGKVAFNIDGLICLVLNIPIQQSLFNLLNLSLYILNRVDMNNCKFL
jgi:hypothetical protein